MPGTFAPIEITPGTGSAARPDPVNRQAEYLAGSPINPFVARAYNSLATAAARAVALHGDALYDAMLDDSVVRSSIDTFKAAILGDDMHLEPAVRIEPDDLDVTDLERQDAERAAQYAEFCERALSYLDDEIGTTLWQILDAIPRGAMLAEATYKVAGPGPDAGLLVPVSLHVKPRSAWDFVVNRAGDVIGFTGDIIQPDPDDRTGTSRIRVLPREKFVLLSWMPRQRDPRGTPALDAAYEAWNMRTLTRPQHWKYLSRFAVPSYWGTTAPDAGDVEEEGTDGSPVVMTAEQAMLRAIQALENASGAVGANGATLETLDPQSDGTPFRIANDEFRREIVFAILCQVRATLEAEHSSKADSESAQDVFGLIVRIGKKLLAASLRRDLFKPLIEWNFGPDAGRLAPLPRFGMVDMADFSRNANAISRLASAGLLTEAHVPAVLAWLGLGFLSGRPGGTPLSDRKKAENAGSTDPKPAS